MLCYRCGSHVPDGSEACGACGQKFSSGNLRQATGTFSRKRLAASPVEGAPYKSGDLLANRYAIKDAIGAGPLGFVFKAQDREIDVEVALKTISPKLLQTPEERRAFAKEVRLARKLSHANIVRVYEDGEDQDRPFYTMQFLDGLTLRRIIELRREKGQTFSLREVEPILGQIASGLDSAHKVGPHCNVKPENVIVLPDLLKLTDFGLPLALPRQPLAAAERAKGGHRYLAPEYLSGQDVDRRADVYSLGVLFGEMVAGIFPDGASTPELRSKNPELPIAAEALYRRATNENPLARHATAGEFFAELAGIVAKTQPKPAPAPAKPARPPPPPPPAPVVRPAPPTPPPPPPPAAAVDAGAETAITVRPPPMPEETDPNGVTPLADDRRSPPPPPRDGDPAFTRDADSQLSGLPTQTLTIEPDPEPAQGEVTPVAPDPRPERERSRSKSRRRSSGAGRLVALVMVGLLVGLGGGFAYIQFNRAARARDTGAPVVADPREPREPRDPSTVTPVDPRPPDDGTAKPDDAQARTEESRRAEEQKRLAEARKAEEAKAREEAARREEERKRKEALNAAFDPKRDEPNKVEVDPKRVEPKVEPAVHVTTPKAGTCPAGMRMVQAGTVRMGSAKDDEMAGFEEKRLVPVEVESYCIDFYEFPNRAGATPQTSVSYSAAEAACKGKNKRLCTEEEWERACKGPGGLRFPYGNAFDPDACNTEDANGEDRSLATAGSFVKCRSGFGLVDMSGNAAEWTSSPYNPGLEDRTLKGGSSDRPDYDTRCAARKNASPGSKSPRIGFRCCADPS